MTNRREFMAGAGAATVASLAGAAAAAPPVGAFALLVDTRFPQAFVHAAGSKAPIHAMQGDVTRFWSQVLEPRWRQGPVAVDGVTTPETLACLELLAPGYRCKVVRRETKGGLVAWTIAPARAG